MTFRLDDGGNANLRPSENGGDFGECARLVNDVEPHVVAGNDFIDRQHRALAFVGHERRNTAFGAAFEVERRVGEVAQHGAGGRILSRATAVIKRVADHIAAHVNGVENVVHAGQHVRVGHEGGVNGNLHWRTAVRFSPRSGNRSGLFDDAQQLDGVAQLLRKLNVEPGDVTDAFHVNLFRPDPETVRERSEDANFVRSVVPIDVQGGLRFGIAESLRLGQNVSEISYFGFHQTEDVIGDAGDYDVQ